MNRSGALLALARGLRQVKTIAEVTFHDDSSLLIHTRLGERIVIYLVDDVPPLALIKKALNDNTRADIHTLFVLARRLLPPDGAYYTPSSEIALLLEAYWGRIYTWRLVDPRLWIVPVAVQRGQVADGEPVDLDGIGIDYVMLVKEGIIGLRAVGDFGRGTMRRTAAAAHDPLQNHYALIGVPTDADEAAVKAAYRRKAMQMHPDSNPSEQATRQMQAVNEAYAAIMKRLRG
jgi:hypothetical protein